MKRDRSVESTLSGEARGRARRLVLVGAPKHGVSRLTRFGSRPDLKQQSSNRSGRAGRLLKGREHCADRTSARPFLVSRLLVQLQHRLPLNIGIVRLPTSRRRL